MYLHLKSNFQLLSLLAAEHSCLLDDLWFPKIQMQYRTIVFFREIFETQCIESPYVHKKNKERSLNISLKLVEKVRNENICLFKKG